MKRFYFNQSHEPRKYRTWILSRETVGEDDFKWLKAFDIPIRVDAPEKKFYTASGNTFTVRGKPLYTLDTTTDKQREMLVLKYGNDVVLLSEEIVLPGSMSECTLSGLTW